MKYNKFKQNMIKEHGFIPSTMERIIVRENGRKNFLIDPKTHEEKGIPVVSPVGMTNNQVFVVCPFCGEIHVHGAGSDYLGARIAQCADSEEHGEYIIDYIIA